MIGHTQYEKGGVWGNQEHRTCFVLPTLAEIDIFYTFRENLDLWVPQKVVKCQDSNTSLEVTGVMQCVKWC